MANRLEELSKKIDTLIRVVVVSSRKEAILKDKTKTRQIEVLSKLGLPNDVVALFVGTTPDAVRARISDIRKKKARKRKGE